MFNFFVGLLRENKNPIDISIKNIASMEREKATAFSLLIPKGAKSTIIAASRVPIPEMVIGSRLAKAATESTMDK